MAAPESTDWIEDKYKTHVVCVVNHIETTLWDIFKSA